VRQPVIVWGLVFAVLLISQISAIAATPRETLETQVNKALAVLRDPALKGESAREIKAKKIWEILDGVFDYVELSKRALAQRWRDFTPDQQKEFTRLFGKLLGNLYMDKITGYTNEKVIFGKETHLSDKTAKVETDIVTATRTIPIHYQMILENGEWKVYDVVIEGVSLVQNYRGQLREILAGKPPEGLLKMLREKVGS
jgi:phospholipid transport system substrate-binding protein